MSDRGNTKVTFALIAYNQEEYIQDALASAFSQTYTPLQIVVSDDCSTDRTFEIVSRIVAGYAGPHEVVVNRNPQNLGIGGQVRRIADLATGDIVIMAAGDDISAPERSAKIVARFDADPAVKAVFSDVSHIDETGAVLCEKVGNWTAEQPITLKALVQRGGGIDIGASYSYRRECFFWPWEYPVTIMNEDRLLPFRAALLGRLDYIDEPLVKYRLTRKGVSRTLREIDLIVLFKPDHIDELISTTRAAHDDKGQKFSRDRMLGLRLAELRLISQALVYFDGNEGWTGRVARRIVYNILMRDSLFARIRAKLP